MAVRESENRRVGGGPEKLLTLEEAARRLGIPADDVEAMVKNGKLQAFRLGGALLRFRLQDVEAVRQKPKRPPSPVPQDRLLDFLYYNDFYLIALLVILTLLALIFAL